MIIETLAFSAIGSLVLGAIANRVLYGPAKSRALHKLDSVAAEIEHEESMIENLLSKEFVWSLEYYRDKAHQNSKDKGFWDGPENDNIPTKLCLMHSEISEWLEAFRKGSPLCEKPIEVESPSPRMIDGALTNRITSEEEEAADLFIRLLDLCGRLGIDLGRVTLAKMEYNAGREKMHGGKRV